MSPGNEFGMLSHSIKVAGERMAERRERHREAQEALAAAEGFDRVYREMDKLRLHLACVTALLIRSKAVTKETYRQIVEAIDAADGVSDGAFSGTITDDGSISAESSEDDQAIRELAQTIREMHGG